MPTAAEELGAYESDTEVAWDLVIFANSPSLPFLDDTGAAIPDISCLLEAT